MANTMRKKFSKRLQRFQCIKYARVQVFSNPYIYDGLYVQPKKLNLVQKNFNLVPKKFNLVPKNFNLVPKKFNLVPKKFNLVPKHLKFSAQKF